MKAIVNLTAVRVVYVSLEGFSSQNIVWQIWAQVPISKLDYGFSSSDVEFEIDPILGIGGTVWLQDLEITWTAKLPSRNADFGGVWVE